jgi:hypothetical protein
LVLLHELPDTNLSEEIDLARIMLRRLLKAAPYPVGVGEQSEGQDDTDWWRLADRLLGRIGRLVEQRARVEEVREVQARLEEIEDRLPVLAA